LINTEVFLSYFLKIIQLSQHVVTLSITAASSHDLKCCLNAQLSEFDQLESRIQTIASQRGWDLPELQPADKWSVAFGFRCHKDTKIAEHLIRMHTDYAIKLLKTYNRLGAGDIQISDICRRFLDCSISGIRKLQPFL